MEETQTQEPAATTEAAPPEAPVTAPQTLEERVAYLEAQNDGLKRVGGLALALVLLLGVLLVHQTYSDLQTTSTRGLTLLNDNNELTGAITADPQGRIQLLQARYGVLPSGTETIAPAFEGYTFFDSQGKPRFMVGQNRETQETMFLVVDPVRSLAWDPFQNAPRAAGATPTPGSTATPVPGSTATPLPGSTATPVPGSSAVAPSTPSPLPTP